jgi:hypothetical protein
VAIDGYTAILAQKPGGIAAERAAFGLAKAREALGQLDLAKKGYEAVAAEHGGGPLKELAEQRAAAMARPAATAWYQWFDSAELAPAPAATPPAAGGAADLLLPGSGG